MILILTRLQKYNSDQLLKYLKETADLVKNENETTQKFALASLYFNYGYNLLYKKNPKAMFILIKHYILLKSITICPYTGIIMQKEIFFWKRRE
jgi:hypothetical protein